MEQNVLASCRRVRKDWDAGRRKAPSMLHVSNTPVRRVGEEKALLPVLKSKQGRDKVRRKKQDKKKNKLACRRQRNQRRKRKGERIGRAVRIGSGAGNKNRKGKTDPVAAGGSEGANIGMEGKGRGRTTWSSVGKNAGR